MASIVNNINDLLSGIKNKSVRNQNGKADASNINANATKKDDKGSYIHSMDDIDPLINNNKESLKEPDYWRFLGERYGINRSSCEEAEDHVEAVSRYAAECREQEAKRRLEVENMLLKNNLQEKIPEESESNDAVMRSKKISWNYPSDNNSAAEFEEDKNKQSPVVDDTISSTKYIENVYEKEVPQRVNNKIQKYEQRLDEIRDLKSRMTRSYWNGHTDELNHLLDKIFHSLNDELQFLFDSSKNNSQTVSTAENSTSADSHTMSNNEENSKLGRAKTILDTYENVYERVDKIRKNIKDEEEVDGYAFYKTRLMIFLMIVGLFFGIFVELAFMSQYTGSALETGTLYDAINSYQLGLKYAMDDAKRAWESNNNSKGLFDIVLSFIAFILSFPIMAFVKAHFVFFFSLLPFVFGFVIKIWLDQISQKGKSVSERSEEDRKDAKVSEIYEGNNKSKRIGTMINGVLRMVKSLTLNESVMPAFILILLLYTVALGANVGIKNSPALGFYAALLSLGLMISMGLIMHNLVKTYSRYKSISKRGLFKKYSLESALDKEFEETNKLIENIKKETQRKNHTPDDKKRDKERDDDSDKSKDIKGQNTENIGINKDEHKVGEEVNKSETVCSNSTEEGEGMSNFSSTDSYNQSEIKSDAKKRIEGYVNSCKTAFKAGYALGKSLDGRGEIDTEYLEKYNIEEIVEKQHKYEKYKNLFSDKIKNNTGG